MVRGQSSSFFIHAETSNRCFTSYVFLCNVISPTTPHKDSCTVLVEIL